MIHRRRKGETIRFGINFDFNEQTFFELIIRIPLPIFIKKKYRVEFFYTKKRYWQYYNMQLYFGVGNWRCEDFSRWLKHWWEYFRWNIDFYFQLVKNRVFSECELNSIWNIYNGCK